MLLKKLWQGESQYSTCLVWTQFFLKYFHFMIAWICGGRNCRYGGLVIYSESTSVVKSLSLCLTHSLEFKGLYQGMRTVHQSHHHSTHLLCGLRFTFFMRDFEISTVSKKRSHSHYMLIQSRVLVERGGSINY